MSNGTSALTISRAAYNHIAALALDCFPEEGCGLLVGTRRGGRIYVAHAVAAANVMPKRLRMRHFEIDPLALFTVQRALRERRRHRPRAAIVGYFHSHPLGVARPSAADLAGAHERGLVTLIAAPERKVRRVAMRAWLRIGDGDVRRFRPLPLRIGH